MSGNVARRATQCLNCHYTTLNAFAALAGISLQPVLTRRSLPQRTRLSSQRNFSQPSTQQTTVEWKAPRPDEQQEEKTDEATVASRESEHGSSIPSEPPSSLLSEGDSTKPWYLQVPSLQQPFSPMAERQKLPDLPDNPPDKLQAILEHLSITIGLDSLTLLDLRHLDPPPALGSNLIMLFGTARSERHLHVSADRFARWLRTEYKLSPYADGLLGRNELKLKLRRKARRAKLMGGVGATANAGKEEDDGIRTGWVCVNIGSIEPEKRMMVQEQDTIEQPEGFVGFGGAVGGVNLVVQMMTEEKREQLDLETLWSGHLRRQERKAERDAEAAAAEQISVEGNEVEEVSSPEQVRLSTIEKSSTIAADPPPTRLSLPKHTLGSFEQRRTFHLSHPKLDFSSVGEVQQSRIPPMLESIDANEGVAKMEHLLLSLRTLSREEAVSALGQGIGDDSSTPFLQEFYSHRPFIQTTRYWELRLQLIRYALYIEHENYSRHDLVKFIEEMQVAVINIPTHIFHSVLNGFFIEAPDSRLPLISPDWIAPAIKILEDMRLRNISVMTPQVCGSLIVGLSRLERGGHGGEKLDDNSTRTLRVDWYQQLVILMINHDIQPPRYCHLPCLHALAETRNSRAFWTYWRGIAKFGERRTQEMYTIMFDFVASSGHQEACATVLMNGLPEMEVEEPPVKITAELADAVMACIRVADPDVERQVERKLNRKAQMVQLYKKCRAALEEPAEELEDYGNPDALA